MIPKNQWHWKCRWFKHEYFKTEKLSIGGGTIYGPYNKCTRCGFDPKVMSEKERPK